MRTVAANAYVAYRSMRGRLGDESWPPKIGPLDALILRFLLVNGCECPAEVIRAEFALPASTLSSALGRLERRGHVRRCPNRIDGRYVNVVLSRDARKIAPLVADVVEELETSVALAAGPGDLRGFDRIAMLLAAMDEASPAP